MCDEEETDNAGDVGDVGDEDNFCQEILLDQCELISSVKNNPALYAKSSKEYSGKGFNKDLVWQSVGSSLTKPLSGHLRHLKLQGCHRLMRGAVITICLLKKMLNLIRLIVEAQMDGYLQLQQRERQCSQL
ncbi:hypothetical protein EAI_10431 [Harpegnathos saltator]|uniref:Uncharacterized protein n=1 Tax=Harpegnathos saltator TaxID=610380 RepID=E2C568_HARSA|nr:hypothetical protein EAI_10431 [Harpegnathos saltator]